MAEHLADKLVISLSSRALFDLEESHAIYQQQGIAAYQDYQIAHEESLLQPGPAFHTIAKLLALKNPQGEPWVEVILLSRNSADTGLRVFNSIQHYGLNITRAAFTSGESPYHYVTAFGAQLFLSANPADVRQALGVGVAAATLLPGIAAPNDDPVLRIAFDGDAVLFSDDSERVYQENDLETFVQNEIETARVPMTGGPFKQFLHQLQRIQASFPPDTSPLRTALVTARSAPAHERVIRTLRAWHIRIDEALFLGGLSKAEFLQAFGADLFFDDQRGHCESTRQHVVTGHVPHGVTNED